MDDGARRHDGVRAYGDAREHRGAGGDPGAVLHHDRGVAVAEVRGTVVMAAGAEQRLLGDTDMRPQGDRLQVEQPGALTDPGVVTHRQLPRPQDPHPVAYQHPFTDRRSEGPQQRDAQPGRAEPRHEDGVHHGEPERLGQPPPALVVPGQRERR